MKINSSVTATMTAEEFDLIESVLNTARQGLAPTVKRAAISELWRKWNR